MSSQAQQQDVDLKDKKGHTVYVQLCELNIITFEHVSVMPLRKCCAYITTVFVETFHSTTNYLWKMLTLNTAFIWAVTKILELIWNVKKSPFFYVSSSPFPLPLPPTFTLPFPFHSSSRIFLCPSFPPRSIFSFFPLYKLLWMKGTFPIMRGENCIKLTRPPPLSGSYPRSCSKLEGDTTLKWRVVD